MRRVVVAAVLGLAALVFTMGVSGPGDQAAGGDKGKKGLTFELYKDAKSEFRWRLRAANGVVIATSGEGYKAKADCTHAIDLIKEGAAKAKVIEVEEKGK